jgi:hypothetical protein
MRLEDFSRRAEELVAMADRVLATKFKIQYSDYVDSGALAGFRAAGLSFLHNAFGPKHPFYTDFDKAVEGRNFFTTARRGREILVAAKAEVEGGWNQRLRTLVSAEIFADFLDMADYLLGQHYKDAAAVMIGGVLEEHLRQLCRRTGLPVETVRDGKPVPKKADALNAELANAGVYNRLDQKCVSAWLDLRNKAAHGRYDEYTEGQVSTMRDAVSDFMARVAP